MKEIIQQLEEKLSEHKTNLRAAKIENEKTSNETMEGLIKMYNVKIFDYQRAIVILKKSI